MRILIVSDTHGQLDPRIADLSLTCEYALHAGDIGHPAVLGTLQPSREVLAVRGNNDVPRKWPAEGASKLDEIPWQADLQLPGGRLLIVHGHTFTPAIKRHERLRARLPQARAIVYGHSHRLVVDTSEVPWVLNPGAAGRERTYGGPSCLLLDVDEQRWQVEAVRLSPTGRRPNVCG